VYGTENLCSEFGENRSVNGVTILSRYRTDTGHWTGHQTPDAAKVVIYFIQCYMLYTALDRKKAKQQNTKNKQCFLILRLK